ncbi:MAG: DUF1801 domain-containing protein [Pseudomonadota bacterium]
MAKANNKTVPTRQAPDTFLKSVEPERRREDAQVLLDLFTRVTGLEPRMWGPSMIGYGRYEYKYDTGREGEYFMTGFSPRKASLSIYIMPGYRYGKMGEKLALLGKYKLGKSCLYINKLDDIDLSILEEIIRDGLDYMRVNYATFDA